MRTAITYASIAIVEFLDAEKIAVEVISVTPETCELSGAWLVEGNNLDKLNQIIAGRLLIFIGDKSVQEDYVALQTASVVNLQEFIDEAMADVTSATRAFGEYLSQNKHEYLAYMSIKVADRKLLPKVVKMKLAPPEFYEWPETISLNSSEEVLTSLGKLGKISGTDEDMRNVLASARLIKHFIDKWRGDEIERRNRLYVLDSEAIVSILPTSWLEKI
ncbi:unannotated protein [freshwater metagenome]|uniref:Unannotated protein n=1 Tax=freshwater metagenome TaxID=449393 RepID=A0A6J6MDH0_9ZZZZ|nr:hypothetical protein [Actinomycetota bacterium]MTA23571.1 hypothetical protein [Actinomycetota bacterium]